MNIAMRVERLREQLVRSGERSRTQSADTSATHTDFSDFSESTGPGDREPNFNDFVDQA